MNIVRFNEFFEQPIKQIAEAQKEWEKIKVSPLFEYSMSEKEMMRSLRERIDETKENEGLKIVPNLPFPIFRLAFSGLHEMSSEDEELGLSGKVRVDMVVVTPANGGLGGVLIFAYAPILKDQQKLRTGLPLLTMIHIAEDESYNWYVYHPFSKEWVGKEDKRLSEIYLTPVVDGSNVVPLHEAGIKAAVLFILNCFVGFLLSAMSPNTHVVKVSPNRPGKSVKWVESRTHYTLISHGHPANRKEVRSGSNVEVDEKAELTRMAHNRRAHKRVLRSDRFRFKKGQEIQVRATWVGPKEWKDKGGKQIYKILEEVKP